MDVQAFADLDAFPSELHPVAARTDDFVVHQDRLVLPDAAKMDGLALVHHPAAGASVDPDAGQSAFLAASVHDCPWAKDRDCLSASVEKAALDVVGKQAQQRLAALRPVVPVARVLADAGQAAHCSFAEGPNSDATVDPVGALTAWPRPVVGRDSEPRGLPASLALAGPQLESERPVPLRAPS